MFQLCMQVDQIVQTSWVSKVSVLISKFLQLILEAGYHLLDLTLCLLMLTTVGLHLSLRRLVLLSKQLYQWPILSRKLYERLLVMMLSMDSTYLIKLPWSKQWTLFLEWENNLLFKPVNLEMELQLISALNSLLLLLLVWVEMLLQLPSISTVRWQTSKPVWRKLIKLINLEQWLLSFLESHSSM